jgi:hypothetical protein
MNGKILLTTSYKAGDLVDIPFSFIDAKTTKRRPSLVLESWTLAGLRKPSVIRWKLFTLDETLILGRRGRLADPDLAAVCRSLAEVFSGWSLSLTA